MHNNNGSIILSEFIFSSPNFFSVIIPDLFLKLSPWNKHIEINLNFSMDFSSILKSAIESIDKSLEIFEESETCGSTGTIVVVDNNNIYCANVGDSKGFYISENTVEQLTEDHNCSNKKEHLVIINLKKKESLVLLILKKYFWIKIM